jgi:hypothetical protein
MIKRLLKYIFLSGVALILLTSSVLAYSSVSMWTVTKLSGSTVTPSSVNFTAYYNGNDDIIQTEDSWNDTNNGEGYWASMGICRTNTDQITGLTVSSTYDIWVSSGKEAGHATGTVGTKDPATGKLVPNDPSYTTKGSFTDPLILSASNYLATPTDINVTGQAGSILLTWKGVSGASGYRIYRRPATGYPDSAIVYERVAQETTNSWTDSKVTAGKTYYYIIVATAANQRSGHTNEISGQSGAGTNNTNNNTNNTTNNNTNNTTNNTTTNVGPKISANINGTEIKTGSTISGKPTITISLTDSDGIKSVAVYMDGTQGSTTTLKASATTNGQYTTSFVPTGVLKEGDHTLKIEAEDNAGAKSTLTVSGLKVFAELRLDGLVMNYPNPFKPTTQSTTINYKLTQNANVKLYIYDIGGRVVYSSVFDAGTNGGRADNDVIWDGKDFSGQTVANGIYICIITADGQVLGKGEIAVVE